MKQFVTVLGFLALCCVIFRGCTGYERNHADINSVDIPTFTDCGGVIPLFSNDGLDSAFINYKYGILYNNNEFCVWTFLAEDTAGDVRIDFLHVTNQSADGIVVYTWKDSNFISHKIPSGHSSLTLDAQHFAVAFSSDWLSPSIGFLFSVFVDKPGHGATNPKAYFSEQSKGEFTYPWITGRDIYDNDKRVSVVLHGPTEKPRKLREYVLRDLDTEKNYDFVEVYVLWPYHLAPHYKFVGRFSGEKSGPVANSTILTPFPVLYLFSSDRKVTGKGFTISWNLAGNGIDGSRDFMVRN